MQPSGPRPVGCFSALLARPISIQIWALRSRLEKQPIDRRRNQRDLGDGTLVSCPRNSMSFASGLRSQPKACYPLEQDTYETAGVASNSPPDKPVVNLGLRSSV